MFIPRKHNIYRRNINRYDKANFLSSFQKINWDNILNNENDTNLSFNSFFCHIEKLLDKYIPLKKVSNKEFKRSFKPWITIGILTSLRKRSELHRRYLRAKDYERKHSKHWLESFLKPVAIRPQILENHKQAGSLFDHAKSNANPFTPLCDVRLPSSKAHSILQQLCH